MNAAQNGSQGRDRDHDAAGQSAGHADGTCGVCAKTLRADRYVCAACITDARDALTAYSDTNNGRSLLAELNVTATRRARMTRPDDTPRATERPLPFNERAAAALADDRQWLTIAATALGVAADPRTPARTAASIAARLPQHAGRPVAIMIATEAKRRAARALALIDRPAATWFAGHCECGHDLYAREGAAAVQCEQCGRQHDVEARRAYLLSLVEDQLATVAEICRAVHLLDQPVTRSQLTNWSSRGQLLKRGHNRNGHAVYRIGDVLNLLATTVRHPQKTRRCT